MSEVLLDHSRYFVRSLPLGFKSIVDQSIDFWQIVDANFDRQWCDKRLQFYFYDLTSSGEKAMSKMLSTIFNDWGFRAAMAKPGTQESYEGLRISDVLRNRRGHPTILTALIGYLSQKIDIDLRVVEGVRHGLIKVVSPTENWYFSLEKGGEQLTTAEVLEAMQVEGPAEFLEELSKEQLFIKYLEQIKEEFISRKDWANSILTLSWILELQPSNLKAIAERAQLYFKLDHKRHCLLNLKRYFSFIEIKNADPRLVNLFSDLSRDC